jgi:2-alkenal reductase
LVDAHGRVIGINTLVVRGNGTGGLFGPAGPSAERLGFAIPSHTVREVVDKLIARGTVVRPYLGITYETITPRIAAYLQLEIQNGALITSVVPMGPAARAGLQAGDVIVQIDEQVVDEGTSLAQLINEHQVKEQVTLTIVRRGSKQTIAAQLDERPSPELRSAQ